MAENRWEIGQQGSARNRFLFAKAGDLEGLTILDLGCGSGLFEEYALEKGCRSVTGVDRDERLLAMARTRAPGADFISQDATILTTDFGTFDLVCMFDFLEHLPREHVPLVVEKAARMLDRGGRLLVSVPFRGIVSTPLDPIWCFGHRHYFLGDMKPIIESAGFQVTGVRYAGDLWQHVAMWVLLVFKWVFRRESPLADYFEKKQTRAYAHDSDAPNRFTTATMFIEAAPPVEAAHAKE